MSSTEPFIVSQRNPEHLRIVQLSDCHIFASAGEILRDVDTRRSLDAVLELLSAQSPAPDLLLVTGDLAEDGSAGAYRYLAQRLPRLGLPCCWLPGNHDRPAVMAKQLRGESIQANRLLLAEHWLVLMLDSTLPGKEHGRVSDEQLDWVDSLLARYRDRHALVALHHQAIDSGSAWIDRKGYPQNAELRQRLLAHANLRAVVWGHVHQQGDFFLGGVRWMSSPSTCGQFALASAEFATGAETPGYRWLELHADGGVASGVARTSPG